MGEKYYKPEIRKEEPLKLQQTGWAGDMPDGSAGGFISTDLEKDVVRQRISKDLYANPSSGIRELYANEARACRTAIGGGHGASIRLTVEYGSRKIVLEGFGSSGMSWDTFANVFCVLGRSTNFDGRESGQFGFGRAAYMCISDIMILETHCRETGERYAVMGKAGEGFQTGLPTPDKGDFGTRVSLTAREDVDLGEIVRMVHACAEMSGVPTEIVLDGRGRNPDNGVSEYEGAVTRKTLGEISAGRFRVDGDYAEAILRKPTVQDVGDDEIEVVVMASPGVGGGRTVAYLCGIPIQYDYVGKYRGHIGLVSVNVRDERKYKPTPDRERLSDEAAGRVSERVDALIEARVMSHGKRTLTGYLSDPSCRLLDCLTNHVGRGVYEGLVPFRHRAMYAGYRSAMAVEASGCIGGGCWPLGSIISGPKVLITRAFSSAILEAIEEHDREIKVVRIPDAAAYDMLEAEGLTPVRRYMKENGIKVKKSAKVPRKTRVYTSWGHKKATSMASDDLPENLVLVGEEFESVQNGLTAIAWNYQSDEFGFRYAKAGSVGPDFEGVAWPDFRESLGGRIYSTSEGVMTVRDICDPKWDLRMVKFPAGKAAGKMSQGGLLAVDVSKQSLLPILLYHGVDGKPDRYGKAMRRGMQKCLRMEDMSSEFSGVAGLVYQSWRDVDADVMRFYEFYVGIREPMIREVFTEFMRGGNPHWSDAYMRLIGEIDARLASDQGRSQGGRRGGVRNE